jgi:hypothetical protein
MIEETTRAKRIRAIKAKRIRAIIAKRARETINIHKINGNPHESDFSSIFMGIRIPINIGKNGDSVILNVHGNEENNYYRKMVLENRAVFAAKINVKKAIESINVDFNKLFS